VIGTVRLRFSAVRILVTGGAGMVGRKLVERLARDGVLGGEPISHRGHLLTERPRRAAVRPQTSATSSRPVLHGEGPYRFDTAFIAAGSRGTDVVTLLVAIPLLRYLKHGPPVKSGGEWLWMGQAGVGPRGGGAGNSLRAGGRRCVDRAANGALRGYRARGCAHMPKPRITVAV
jgi:hypothetical protein